MPARLLRRAGAATAVAATAALLASPGATAVTPADGPVEITPRGVGAVELGTPFRVLREGGLVGRLHGGCELAGPGTRAADLRRPLRGGVDFTRNGTPRVTNITVRGGAAARGVEVGDRAREIRSAFPGARFDHGTDETFGITLVKVPRRAGGRLQFAVDVETRRVQAIGVPFIAFCE